MDFFVPIVIIILFFIIVSVCGWCCKKKREGATLGWRLREDEDSNVPLRNISPPYPLHNPSHPLPDDDNGGTGVTVTTQHISASPVVVPPYPVDAQHPTPYTPAPPQPGFANTGAAPYPTHGGYPPPGAAICPPGPIGGTPYPPPSSALPPSYSEAVGQPHPPYPTTVNEGYVKQAPYNPNY